MLISPIFCRYYIFFLISEQVWSEAPEDSADEAAVMSGFGGHHAVMFTFWKIGFFEIFEILDFPYRKLRCKIPIFML